MTDESKKIENQPAQTIYINQIEKSSNGIGAAGFVLALIALLMCWVPVISWLIWLVGLALSFVGVFEKPKGLAIAGLVISLIDFIILLLMLTILVSAFASVFAF